MCNKKYNFFGISLQVIRKLFQVQEQFKSM